MQTLVDSPSDIRFGEDNRDASQKSRFRRVRPNLNLKDCKSYGRFPFERSLSANRLHLRCTEQGGTARMIGLFIHTIQYSYQRNAAIPGELHVCASSTPNVITAWLVELYSLVVLWLEIEEETRKTGLARRYTPPLFLVRITCSLSFYLFLYANRS